MDDFDLNPIALPPETQILRNKVRQFCQAELQSLDPVEKAKSWFGFDPAFSRKLGERGWIGMTWPAQYGGHDRPSCDRYVVIEELLTAGAPVGAHWIADRQSGPLILQYGSEAAKAAFLPGIARGEIYFCIGMSEPGAGSDLAAIRTRADRVDGGWLVNGTKLWTTGIAHAHQMIALVRTEPPTENRHTGLSQMIVDLDTSGVTRSTVVDMQGEEHFGEVHFDDVFVPDDRVIGEVGNGWAQVNAELALERSGPERYLSSYRLFEEMVLARKCLNDPVFKVLAGELTARIWTLRQMSLSVFDTVGNGRHPALEAAIVKDLGASLEQDIPMLIQAHSAPADTEPELAKLMDYLLQFSPIYSLRGGTREILRGIIAKEAGLR